MNGIVSRQHVLVFLVFFAPIIQAASDTSLFDAIRNGDEKRVASLLKKDAGVIANSRNQQGATALMHAALNANPAVVKLLLNHGADPNARNPIGATALMWAAGDPVKVKLLIENGADVQAKSNMGRTPLMIASTFAGNSKTIRLLLAKRADPKALDQTGEGPLSNAASAADVTMLKELLAAGASVHERGSLGPAMQGMTPLMNAARANCAECVRLLVESGSDVNAVSADARIVKAGLQELGKLTPLVIAAAWGSKDLMRPLLEAGASVEARDTRGLTPLMFAVANERQDTRAVRLLLDHGAQADVQANDAQSALSWAQKWGRDTDLVRLIAERGGRPGKVTNYVPPTNRATQRRSAAEAVERSVALLQTTNTNFFLKGGCVESNTQFSSSNARSRCASLTSSPPYFAFQA